MAGSSLPSDTRQMQLNIASDPASVADVRRAIEQFSGRHGFDRASSDEIGLCVNEALANVIRHAYGGRTDRPIVVRAEYGDGTLRISIRDWGSGVDPGCTQPQRRDPLEPGGLGMLCLREMMDDVRFVPQADGMLLVLVRGLHRQSGREAPGDGMKQS
jgi:anti-sigma regulatory factor (Ser/Thr protein kinase)